MLGRCFAGTDDQAGDDGDHAAKLDFGIGADFDVGGELDVLELDEGVYLDGHFGDGVADADAGIVAAVLGFAAGVVEGHQNLHDAHVVRLAVGVFLLADAEGVGNVDRVDFHGETFQIGLNDVIT